MQTNLCHRAVSPEERREGWPFSALLHGCGRHWAVAAADGAKKGGRPPLTLTGSSKPCPDFSSRSQEGRIRSDGRQRKTFPAWFYVLALLASQH